MKFKMVDIRIKDQKDEISFRMNGCPSCEDRGIDNRYARFGCKWGGLSNEFCTKKDWECCPLNQKLKGE